MGHERVGVLPKSKRWRSILNQIAKAANDDFDVSIIAQQTLKNVRRQFRILQTDDSTRMAFIFLVDLAISTRTVDTLRRFAGSNDLEPSQITPLKLGRILRQYTDDNDIFPEYTAIAEGAAIDAIALWYDQHKPTQQSLFESIDSSEDTWRKVGNGSGFCELSRLFFGKVTERYLKYFLEREASQTVSTLDARQRFGEHLESYLDDISRHAFETSKITQSYAAGWFNRYATDGTPTEQEINRFISYAFGKLQDELIREGRN